MNENIDLTKILKDCPKGWKFYSTIYGEVEFEKIREDSEFPIVLITKYGNNRDVQSDGRYYGNFDGECTVFPSKDQRDWSKFTAPWYKKEKALSQTNERAWLYLVSDVLTWKDGIGQYLDDPRVQELAKKLCSEYSQKLYNPSDKKPKFDPKTLQPFDKVLVKGKGEWYCTFFSHIRKDSEYPYKVSFSSYQQCIPFNDETKHLVGTTEEAPEFYRYWEE